MSKWLNSHDWRENIPCPVNSVDLDRWQSELDSIVGVENDGTKRWRFVWGQDLGTASVWDRYRREWIPRYVANAIRDYVSNPATGVIELKNIWIGVPRLWAEALVPKRRDSVTTECAGLDPDGDVFTERRQTGPEYMPMFCVTQHDIRVKDNWRVCCLRRMKQGQTCFGRYRPPDQVDIDTLREDFDRRITSKLCRPGEELSASDKQFLYHSWILDHLRDEKRRNDQLDDSKNEILATVLKWPGTSFDSKKNRFSIPSLQEIHGDTARIRSSN